MMFYQKIKFFIFIVPFFLINACQDDNSQTSLSEVLNVNTKGIGFFTYNYAVNGFEKNLKVYYVIPNQVNSSSQLLFVFHGVDRNAKDYRDALIAKSQQKGILIFAPEFSIQQFPTNDQYGLGNVYVDGDNPSVQTLNPEHQWSFSIIEALFAYIKNNIQNNNNTFNIIGHSAGAQFVERFLLFKPNNLVQKSIISAAGWYTFPNNDVIFPYGLNQSILQNQSMGFFYSKDVIVMVGSLDNDPNASNLRNNEFTIAQGAHRLARAINFFQYGQQQANQLGLPFNWQFRINNNATHNYSTALNFGFDFLYP